MQRYADLSTLLSEQMRDSKTTEYAARYHAQEQQMEIERQTLRSHTQNVIIIVLFVAIMIIVFFYNHTVFQKKRLAEKNKIMIRLIDDLTKQNMLMTNSAEKNKSIRLSEACRLIREEPDKTITAIAGQLGLSSRTLQKLFREQYGISPTEYRASHTK